MKPIKLITVLTLILFVLSFAACSNDDKTQTPQVPSSSQSNAENKAGSSDSSKEENTKYGDAKVYEKDGVPHAKTEEGEEVSAEAADREMLRAASGKQSDHSGDCP